MNLMKKWNTKSIAVEGNDRFDKSQTHKEYDLLEIAKKATMENNCAHGLLIIHIHTRVYDWSIQ